MRKIRITLFFVALLMSAGMSAQQLAVKSNLAFDAVALPNLGIEMVTSDHTSFGVNVLAGGKVMYKDMTMKMIQPEFRYWLKPQPMSHFYVGIIGLAGLYKGEMMDNCYDGHGLGLGVSGGYVLHLSKRLNLECALGVGGMYLNRKKYDVGADPTDLEPSTTFVPSPLQLAVSLSYVIR